MMPKAYMKEGETCRTKKEMVVRPPEKPCRLRYRKIAMESWASQMCYIIDYIFVLVQAEWVTSCDSYSFASVEFSRGISHFKYECDLLFFFCVCFVLFRYNLRSTARGKAWTVCYLCWSLRWRRFEWVIFSRGSRWRGWDGELLWPCWEKLFKGPLCVVVADNPSFKRCFSNLTLGLRESCFFLEQVLKDGSFWLVMRWDFAFVGKNERILWDKVTVFFAFVVNQPHKNHQTSCVLFFKYLRTVALSTGGMP